MFELYREYQLRFKERSLTFKDDKIDKLEKLIRDNETKAQEEREKSEERYQKLIGTAENIQGELEETNDIMSEIAKERVVQDRISYEKKSYLVILKDKNDKEVPYYVIRSQKRNINTSIKSIKCKYPDADLKRILKIKHPNAIAFWEDIKQKYNKNIEIIDGNWFCLNDISELKFKKKIKKLNQNRIDVI